uniref:Secretoglobin family 1C member 1 n=1 Tax=Ornithorhynchus anatinus TaxID=9258 RepID=A0A6I8NP38_ORNAN
MKLSVAFLCFSLIICCYSGAASGNEFFLDFLQTLLVGSLKELYEGPLSHFKINAAAKRAMAELKSCIDHLEPQNKAELVKLLVKPSFFNSIC